MKNFPYKILFLCMFLPPVFYLLTIQGVENYLHRQQVCRLGNILIGDMDALLEGRYSVREEVPRNLGEYLKQSWLPELGVEMDILVKTKDGRIIYPPPSQPNQDSPVGGPGFNYLEVAADNYQALKDGLDLSLSLRVRFGGWLSIGILLFYIFSSLAVLQHFVRKSIRAAEEAEAEQNRRIQELSQNLKEAGLRLEQIRSREAEYRERMAALKREKEELSRDVDGLLEEMENLEKGLEEEKSLKEKVQSEMSRTREELEGLRIREKHPGASKKRKRLEAAQKRFKVLYKDITMTDRAVEGYLSLPEKQQLKAEEIISRLNHNGGQVHVRRKVFTKGGKKDILETEFSYAGRLYFQRDAGAGIKVLAIGTKNTQTKDLAYLETVE